MIRMIYGATRIGNRVITSADGPFSTDPKSEEYLVSRGVAAYCDAAASSSPAARDERPEPSVNTGQLENTAECEKTAFLDPEQFEDMNFAQLKKLAKDMGLDITGARSKAALIEMICAEPVTPGDEEPDDETPPDLTAEEPIV